METLIIKKGHYEKIITHSKSSLPHEAVGIIAGDTNGNIITTFQLVNETQELNSFFVNPYSQFKIFNLIKERNLFPIALYHSHPEGSPILSPTDIFYAKRHDLIQVIISLKFETTQTETIRAYKVSNTGTIREIPVIVT